MAERNQLQPGRVRRFRDARRWSQQELASVAGLSRPEISAIETGRIVPSVKVALALGHALGVTVEALFGSDGAGIEWAWAPRKFPSRVWLATVGARRLAFPCESSGLADWPHDAVSDGERLPEAMSTPPTLVVAGCDPAASLLQACLRERGIRTLVLVRSSSRALALLKAGLAHVAGVHLSGPGASGNRRAVRERIGGGYRLARWAMWETGIATAPALGLGSLEAQRLRRLSWVGREEGSGARRCMDALFRGGRAPRCELVANDHREVAQTVRPGAADERELPRRWPWPGMAPRCGNPARLDPRRPVRV